MSTKKNSISEVQRISGVSASTVSRVLRGVPGISEETRRRVLEAVEKIGYEPNKRLQRHFKRVHSRRYSIQYLIGRAYAGSGNQFFQRMLWPLEKELAARRCALVVSSIEESVLGDGTTYAVSEGFVEGMIVGQVCHDLVRSLAKQVPVVMFNAEERTLPVDSVAPDVERAIFDQMEYLHGLGHRRIACFHPHEESNPREHWQDARFWFAYKKFLIDRGIALPDSYFDPLDISPETNAEAVCRFAERLFADPGRAPTAILTADVYTPWLARELSSRGLRIPADVSIMGYDDFPHEEALPFGLSTYRQDFDEMARAAVELLMARLEGDHRSPRVVEVGGSLIHRESVAPPREARKTILKR